MKVSQSIFGRTGKKDWIFSDINFESIYHFDVYLDLFVEMGWEIAVVKEDKWECSITLTNPLADKWILFTYPLYKLV